jgi:acyl-CoA-binding protein
MTMKEFIEWSTWHTIRGEEQEKARREAKMNTNRGRRR